MGEKKRRKIVDRETIKEKIATAAKLADSMFATRGVKKFSAVWIREGAERFATELLEKIETPHEVLSIKISSYGASKSPETKPRAIGEIPTLNFENARLIDDIFDTGASAEYAKEILLKRGAKRVFTCFLIDKMNGLKKPFEPDIACLKIENVFVAGYGMDDVGKCRELDDIYEVL